MDSSNTRTLRAIEIAPVMNGWIVTAKAEGGAPQPWFHKTAAEACQAAAEFLEPGTRLVNPGVDFPS